MLRPYLKRARPKFPLILSKKCIISQIIVTVTYKESILITLNLEYSEATDARF